MWRRGSTYLKWADASLHCRTHAEVLAADITIDVQVRLSREGITQLFLGVYDCDGEPIQEEAFNSRPEESMTAALLWGVARARSIGGLGEKVGTAASSG